MRTCKGPCGIDKPLEDFYKVWYKKGDGTQARTWKCKECTKATSAKQRTGASRESYLSYQRTYHKTYDRDARLERIKKLDEMKAFPCSDCGNSFPPECMDFDHREPKLKSFTISGAVVTRSHSWEEVLLEVKKCRLICANCHRIRTARQQNRGGRDLHLKPIANPS